jgi:small subunit ribosomal protein S20
MRRKISDLAARGEGKRWNGLRTLTIIGGARIIRRSLDPLAFASAAYRVRTQTEFLTVANIKSARKRARQADKTRLLKMGQRSRMRTQIKAVITAVEKGDKEAAVAAYKAAVPVIDSMINKGVVNKNKAARHKSRLNKMVKALAA